MSTSVPPDLEIGLVRWAQSGPVLELLAGALAGEGVTQPAHGVGVDGSVSSAFVARSAGQVVGAIVMTARSGEGAGECWRIGPIAVSRGYRGRGIGAALMQVCRARLDAAGESALAIACTPDAADFFARFGMRTTELPTSVGVPDRPLGRPASRSWKEPPK